MDDFFWSTPQGIALTEHLYQADRRADYTLALIYELIEMKKKQGFLRFFNPLWWGKRKKVASRQDDWMILEKELLEIGYEDR